MDIGTVRDSRSDVRSARRPTLRRPPISRSTHVFQYQAPGRSPPADPSGTSGPRSLGGLGRKKADLRVACGSESAGRALERQGWSTREYLSVPRSVHPLLCTSYAEAIGVREIVNDPPQVIRSEIGSLQDRSAQSGRGPDRDRASRRLRCSAGQDVIVVDPALNRSCRHEARLSGTEFIHVRAVTTLICVTDVGESRTVRRPSWETPAGTHSLDLATVGAIDIHQRHPGLLGPEILVDRDLLPVR